jgi:hypothetical protein
LNSIGTRIVEWGQSRYGSDRGWLTRCAADLEMDPSSLQKYIRNERRPGVDFQAKLRALGCDIEWLMTGKKREEDGHAVLDIGAIPLIGKITANPQGKLYFEDFPEGLTIPWVKGDYIALVVENDSLINAPEGDHSTEIYPGDVCIFQLNRQPRTGDIVAVQRKQSHELMVKILKHKSADEIELASANKFRNYPSLHIKKEEIATSGVFAGKIKLARAEMKGRGIG